MSLTGRLPRVRLWLDPPSDRGRALRSTGPTHSATAEGLGIHRLDPLTDRSGAQDRAARPTHRSVRRSGSCGPTHLPIGQALKEYDEASGDDASEVASDADSDVSQSGGGDSGGA